MHDLQLFRTHLEQTAERLASRGFQLDQDAFRAIDARRREALTEVERLKAERNDRSKDIGARKKAGEDTTDLQASVRTMGDRIAELESSSEQLDVEFRDLLKGIPNLPHESVPKGHSAEDNVEIRREGTPRTFDFEPKPHWDLGVDLGILDFERAAKITGARFAVYFGLGARLERALMNFMLDTHTAEHGYTETLPPYLVNSESLYGTGQLPKFAEDLFKCEDTDYWLAPTAEVPVTNLLRDETVDAEKLPIKFCSYTSCFRSEAGSHGRDVRGIIRQHQFQKVELVKFAHPDHSYAELDSLTNDAETILRKLGLPFRTMELCTGDMGFGSAKTFDIEVWLPGQNAYKEISSCSNYESFQARRAGIRFRGAKKNEFVHTLNGSGLAIGRTWVAIVENYQQKDGSILVPEQLRPYLNAEVITKNSLLS
ncbi:serine--tRNA ligase [Bryobacter aggregatus]|uniref:serine--tRNA ligase n=1 Tax=Bryobacter aggregatus TaxID=360054 RepID=UPI0004E23F35|nr:serine--tRNA ligase [Bryobacter aggregatus]